MIKRMISGINFKKIGVILLALILAHQLYEYKIVTPSKKKLIETYINYQNCINEKIILPLKYQSPDVPVPGYFSNEITIDLAKLMDRYLYKGSKVADEELKNYSNLVNSQILKQQMIHDYNQKIDSVLDFDYKVTRASLKLIVSTNKETLTARGLEKIKIDEYYIVHYRKQNSEWKIFWIDREQF